jgi:hypothetical protein
VDVMPWLPRPAGPPLVALAMLAVAKLCWWKLS